MANLGLLQRMVGTWEGTGICQYHPNVPVIPYLEQLTIRQGAKPIVFEYRSATQHAQNGNILHVETGYFRCPPNSDQIEIVVSHPFGVAEVSEGRVGDSSCELSSSEGRGIIRVTSSKGAQTTQIVRRYKLTENELEFGMDMATSAHELQNHLVSKLKRVS